eukprot:COSAG06_NODE_9229_length_1953_cov_1.271305_1_plen_253_part_10
MVVPHLITIILRTGAQMQSGEPGSKLLHESIYSRVWEQDTPAGSFLEIILRAGNTRLPARSNSICPCPFQSTRQTRQARPGDDRESTEGDEFHEKVTSHARTLSYYTQQHRRPLTATAGTRWQPRAISSARCLASASGCALRRARITQVDTHDRQEAAVGTGGRGAAGTHRPSGSARCCPNGTASPRRAASSPRTGSAPSRAAAGRCKLLLPVKALFVQLFSSVFVLSLSWQMTVFVQSEPGAKTTLPHQLPA